MWQWIIKIAIQLIPILIGLDWNKPKPGEKFIGQSKRKKKSFFYDL